MTANDVISILGKYANNNNYFYSYSVNSYGGVIPVVPVIHYESSLGVSTEKFEGSCSVYLKDEKVIYIESTFD